MDFLDYFKSLKDNPGMQELVNQAPRSGDPSLMAPPVPMAPPTNAPAPVNPDVMSMLGVPQVRPDLVTPQNPPGLSPLLSPMRDPLDQQAPGNPTNVSDFNRAQQTPKALKKEAKATKAVEKVQEKAAKQELKDDEIIDPNKLDDKTVQASKDKALMTAQKAQYTNNADDLAAAQRAKNDFVSNLLMLQAGSDVGRSLAGVKTNDNQIYKDFAGIGEGKVQDVKDKQAYQNKENEESRAKAGESRAEATEERNAARAPIEMAQMQKNLEKEGINLEAAKLQLSDAKAQSDPNSDVSKATVALAGQMAKTAGINLPIKEGMSYSQIQQLMPSVTKFIDAKMASDVRKDANATKRQEKLDKSEEKNSQLVDKRYGDMNKALQEELASGRSGLGTDVKNYNSIQNIKALISGDQDLNHLDNRELYEVARSLDRVLSQGGSTISGAEHLTPDTARTRVAKLMEFISGQRQSANAGSFVSRTLNTLEREEEQAKHRINDSKMKTLNRFSDLQKKDGDRWNQTLRIHGIPADVLEKGPQQSPTDKRSAAMVAKAPHNGKYPPGSVVTVKGKNYVVGDDGDSLTPQ